MCNYLTFDTSVIPTLKYKLHSRITLNLDLKIAEMNGLIDEENQTKMIEDFENRLDIRLEESAVEIKQKETQMKELFEQRQAQLKTEEERSSDIISDLLKKKNVNDYKITQLQKTVQKVSSCVYRKKYFKRTYELFFSM